MAMPSLKTIEVPFATGLAQKTDPLWQEATQGQAAIEVNLAAIKSGSIQKRQGLAMLSNIVQFPGLGIAGGGGTLTAQAARRAFTYKQQPHVILEDSFGPIVCALDPATGGATSANVPVALDRVPEAYIPPPRVIFGSETTPINPDIAIVSGYRVMVWCVSINNASTPSAWMPFYKVEDAVTGATVIPPQSLKVKEGAAAIAAPRVIAVTGGAVILWPSSDGKVWAVLWSTASPYVGAGVHTTLVSDANTDLSQNFPYDAYCDTANDGGNFWIIYQQKLAGPIYHNRIAKFSSSTFASVLAFNVDGTDGTWTADFGGAPANAILRGCTLRANKNQNEIAFAYSWANAGTIRVSWGLYTYLTQATVCSSVNLMTVPGPLSTSTSINQVPYTLAIERVGTTGSGLTQEYKVAFSPGNSPTAWDTSATCLSCWIALYIVGNNAGAGAVDTNQPRVTWGAYLASRLLAFRPQGSSSVAGYMIGYTPSSTQGGWWLFCDDAWADTTTPNTDQNGVNAWSPMRLCGNIAPRQALATAAANNYSWLSNSYGPTWTHFVQGSPASSVNGYQTISPYEAMIWVNSSASLGSIANIQVDLAPFLAHQTCELGDNAIIAGGSPSGFDGVQTFELGFPLYPVITNITMAGAGGNLSAGVYAWIAIFEWKDAKGQVHRSGRSVPVTKTAVNSDKATITVTCAGFSAKLKSPNAFDSASEPQSGYPSRPPIAIKLYRSLVNAVAPINYFNIDASDVVAAGNTQNVYSTTNTPVTTVVDTTADAALNSHPLLYGDGSDGTSSGNLLDNLCAPSFQGVITHNSRLWGIDGNRIWPSKAFTTGEGSAFNESMAFSVDDGPGVIQALASMDDKLVIFKNDRVLYTSGYGPADNGLDNDLIPPVRVASDCGIVDWRSAVSTPDGVYFHASQGRRLLTRDMQVKSIPFVEDLDAQFPDVTSAIIHPTAGRIYWTQKQTEGSRGAVVGGIQVLYDYVLEHWSVSQLGGGAGMAGACVANAAAGFTAGLRYFCLRDDGFTFLETAKSSSPAANDFFDQTALTPTYGFTGLQWQSPWIKSDGLQGWSHWWMLRLAFQMLDPADLQVTIAYDYATSITDSFTFTADQIAAFTTPIPQIEMQPTNARAEAMQITISDNITGGGETNQTSTGQGFKLLGLRVSYGTEPGGYRAPVAQRG